MAKIDLTSFEWCELIFKGKNKAYGAYKMRADSPKRHNVAMVIALMMTVGVFFPLFISESCFVNSSSDILSSSFFCFRSLTCLTAVAFFFRRT